jgi:hypothetical protein
VISSGESLKGVAMAAYASSTKPLGVYMVGGFAEESVTSQFVHCYLSSWTPIEYQCDNMVPGMLYLSIIIDRNTEIILEIKHSSCRGPS